jgi:hypothetical protein
MSPPPFPLGSQPRRDGDRREEIDTAPSNPFIYDDDDSQQDQDAFSQTQRDVPKSQMSGSEEEVSGTQLDPRRKYCEQERLVDASRSDRAKLPLNEQGLSLHLALLHYLRSSYTGRLPDIPLTLETLKEQRLLAPMEKSVSDVVLTRE